MKKLMFTTLSLLISLAATAQWVRSGNNITNDNLTGTVNVRQDITDPALANGVGALFAFGSTSHTSGTALRSWGAYLLGLNQSTGTLTQAIGAYAIGGNLNGRSGTVTSGYGIMARVQAGAGTVNTGYGVYIENTQATTDYGIYQEGADDNNFFAGNVGIGTKIPDQKLTVKGKIHAEEVVIDLSVPGPDYVFESSYKLPSLEELNAYIKINKHLPEVPSACTMEENSVNLGEMNMLLLKKVEELTLYSISQNTAIQLLIEQNKHLEQRLNNLETR